MKKGRVRMKNIFSYLSCVGLFTSIVLFFTEVSWFDSAFLPFYSVLILSFLLGLIAEKGFKKTEVSPFNRVLSKVGFYGSVAIAILFFPTIYNIWGTLFFGV